VILLEAAPGVTIDTELGSAKRTGQPLRSDCQPDSCFHCVRYLDAPALLNQDSKR
jgi:hypothetical protein